VGEHDAADHVPDRPHALDGAPQVIVDDDAASLELDAGSLRAKALCVRRATDREQHLVGVDGPAALAAAREPHLQRAAHLRDLGDLAARVDLATQAGEVLRIHGHQVGFDHGQNLREHLEHRDLAAQGGEHGGELHADDAAANHGQPLRDFLQLQDRVRVDGELGTLQRDSRHGRAGGDDDVLSLHALAVDVDRAAAGELARAADHGHPARLEKPFHALDELVDDRRLPLLGGGPVEGDVVGDEPERGSAFGQRVQLRRLQQRLGRDAAADQAGPAKPILLDDRRLRAQLRGPDGGHVTARPTTYHRDIEGIGHIAPIYTCYQY